jgi:hypothetical protein
MHIVYSNSLIQKRHYDRCVSYNQGPHCYLSSPNKLLPPSLNFFNSVAHGSQVLPYLRIRAVSSSLCSFYIVSVFATLKSIYIQLTRWSGSSPAYTSVNSSFSS